MPFKGVWRLGFLLTFVLIWKVKDRLGIRSVELLELFRFNSVIFGEAVLGLPSCLGGGWEFYLLNGLV